MSGESGKFGNPEAWRRWNEEGEGDLESALLFFSLLILFRGMFQYRDLEVIVKLMKKMVLLETETREGDGEVDP